MEEVGVQGAMDVGEVGTKVIFLANIKNATHVVEVVKEHVCIVGAKDMIHVGHVAVI